MRRLGPAGIRRGLRAPTGAPASAPTNTQAPTLGGGTYAGSSPAITPGTWTGSPTLTYSLEVNGVEVASGTEAQVEAYVYTLADEGYNAQLREIPNGNAALQASSDTVTIDLAAYITAQLAAVSWDTPGIFLVRRSALDLTLVGSAVSAWLNQGTGSDATQATGTSRPTYSATAVNSLPGMTLDGGDFLATGNIDTSAHTAVSLLVLFSDSDTAPCYVAEFGQIVSGQSGFVIRTNNPGAGGDGVIEAAAFNVAGPSAASAASYPMTSPAVVTGTWDSALATNELEIRHAGVNVTSTRPANSDTSAAVASPYPLVIGARYNGTLPIKGAMCAVILAAGSTAIPTSTVAEVEAILAAAWGL